MMKRRKERKWIKFKKEKKIMIQQTMIEADESSLFDMKIF